MKISKDQRQIQIRQNAAQRQNVDCFKIGRNNVPVEGTAAMVEEINAVTSLIIYQNYSKVKWSIPPARLVDEIDRFDSTYFCLLEQTKDRIGVHLKNRFQTLTRLDQSKVFS